MSEKAIRGRQARGMSPEEVLCPVRRQGRRQPRSAAGPVAARAQELLESARKVSDSPWEALWVSIVARSVLDWFDLGRRVEVESFFRSRWFAVMSGDCGEEIIQTLRKEDARGRQKSVYAGRGYHRAV